MLAPILHSQGNAVGPIKALVRSHVKGSKLLSNVGAEVSFQLPNDASPSFKAMLLEMDNRKEELGINRWGGGQRPRCCCTYAHVLCFQPRTSSHTANGELQAIHLLKVWPAALLLEHTSPLAEN